MIAVNKSPYQMVPRNLRTGGVRWYLLHGRRITKYIVGRRYLHIRPTGNCRNNTTLRCKTPLTQGDGQLPPSSLFALLAHYHRRRLQHAWMTGPVSLLYPLSVDRSQADDLFSTWVSQHTHYTAGTSCSITRMVLSCSSSLECSSVRYSFGSSRWSAAATARQARSEMQLLLLLLLFIL